MITVNRMIMICPDCEYMLIPYHNTFGQVDGWYCECSWYDVYNEKLKRCEMPIQFEYRERGLKEMQRRFRLLEGSVKRGRVQPMKKAGEKAVEVIRKRTARGKDIAGAAFAPYSAKYAKKKGGRPDLKVSGAMMAAVSSQAWAKKARIYIAGSREWMKGRVHNVGGRSGRGTGFSMTKREFMGIEREKNIIAAVIRADWTAYVRQLGL